MTASQGNGLYLFVFSLISSFPEEEFGLGVLSLNKILHARNYPLRK